MLCVWLPLNGDLKNQGLEKITVTNNGTTIDNNGKIGKCYIASATSNNITYEATNLSNLFSGTVKYSFTCWIKSTMQQGWVIKLGTTNNIGLWFGLNTSRWVWNDSDNGKRVATVDNSEDTTRWHHLAIIIDKTNLSSINYKFYFDGIEYSTSSNFDGSSKTQPTGNKIIIQPYYGQVQDIRIYNHCLSPEEVKEIAKGLVLHYPLNNNGLGNTNLVKGNYQCTSTKDNFSSSGNLTFTLTAAELLAHKGETLTLSYDVYSMGDKTSNGSGFTGAGDRFGIHGSIKYTLTGGGSSTQVYPLADLLNAGKNGHYSSSWTIPSNLATIDNNLSFSIQTNPSSGFAKPASTNNTTWYLKNVKVEFGNRSTTWSPSPADSSLPTNIIYDSSGYNNNGDITNGTIITPSMKYNAATQLNGTTVDSSSNTKTGAAYLRGFLPLTSPIAITISWFGKNDAYGRGGIFQTTALADPSECTDYNSTAIANWDSTFRVYNGSSYADFFSSFIKDGNWHHHAITYDGANVRYYCDGVQKTSKGLTGALPSITGFCMGLGKAGGVYRQIKETISDLRIYVTALSADDILKLYKDSMVVSGNTITPRSL